MFSLRFYDIMYGMREKIERMYSSMFANHFANNRQMILLSGPRQVGKTTVAKSMSDLYLNWDRRKDRALFLKGEDEIAKVAKLDVRRRGISTHTERIRVRLWPGRRDLS